MGRPLTLDGLPQSPLPQYDDLSLGNTDFSQDRTKVEEALMSRLNPQLDRDRASLESTLVNQGFTRGSEGFNRAMDEANRTATDARMQAVLAGGQEQTRLTELSRARGLYEMGLRQQGYSDTQQARERGLQEQLALRNQPINEISALMSGGQVTMPQFTPYRAQPMSETPIGQYMYQSAAMNNQNAIAKAQAQQAQMAGLFSLAGDVAQAGAKAWAFSDRRLKKDINAIGTTRDGLTLYTFRYVNDNTPSVGFMADEVAEVFPCAVAERDGFLMVDYAQVRFA
jgi:predicted lipoprotein with Yx(FWY)xxD motif